MYHIILNIISLAPAFELKSKWRLKQITDRKEEQTIYCYQ